MTVQISIALEEDQAARLQEIAVWKAATAAEVVAEAVASYLDYDAWFVAKVEKGLVSVAEGHTAPFEDVAARMRAVMDLDDPST